METETKKFNPYVIIIVVLLVIIAGLAYSKWGKDILPSSKNEPEKEKQTASIEDLGGDIIVGQDNASVTIVEYYSYFCGYCELYHNDTYPKIVENYISKGKVKYIFRPYPPYELGSAVACADDQDGFLEYHNELFAKAQEIQGIDDLKTLAKDIGLDEDKFSQCFDSQKYIAKAEAWYKQGDKDFADAGVPENQRGTPSFFINGEILVGAQPYENFVEIIEKKLVE